MELQLSVVNFRDLALVSIVSLLVYWFWSRRQYYVFAWRLPGKIGLPLKGSLFVLNNVLRDMASYGPVFEREGGTLMAWMGLQPAILTIEPELAEKILTSPDCLEKAFPFYEPLHYFLNEGMVTSHAQEWRLHRKKLSPVFKQENLLGFFPIFNKAKNKMAIEFEKFLDGKAHFLLGTVQTNMGRIVMETSLDQPEFDYEKLSKMVRCIVYLLSVTSKEMVMSALDLNKVARFFFNTTRKHQFKNQYIRDFFEKFFNAKEREEKSLKEESSPLIGNGSPENEYKQERNSVINHVYKMYKEKLISREKAFNEVATIFIASLETSANTIFSTIAFLAMHPAVQQRLFEEIAAVYSEKDAEVEYDHLKLFPYLELVLLETMRLSPAGPIVGRKNSKPMELYEGHIMPENMQIMISVFHLHRSKKIWGPNADKFNPDNFLPENSVGRHSYAYIPFSKGPRNCFGMRYAQLAMKVMIIGLVRNFRFETDFRYEDLKVKFHMTSAYKKEPGIRVYRRL